MFGIKKLRAENESLKIELSKLRDRIAHMKEDRKQIKDEQASFIKLFAEEGEKQDQKLSLLDINMDGLRNGIHKMKSEFESEVKAHSKEMIIIDKKLEGLRNQMAVITTECQIFRKSIDDMMPIVFKPKQKRGRKPGSKNKPKPEKKDE